MTELSEVRAFEPMSPHQVSIDPVTGENVARSVPMLGAIMDSATIIGDGDELGEFSLPCPFLGDSSPSGWLPLFETLVAGK